MIDTLFILPPTPQVYEMQQREQQALQNKGVQNQFPQAGQGGISFSESIPSYAPAGVAGVPGNQAADPTMRVMNIAAGGAIDTAAQTPAEAVISKVDFSKGPAKSFWSGVGDYVTSPGAKRLLGAGMIGGLASILGGSPLAATAATVKGFNAMKRPYDAAVQEEARQKERLEKQKLQEREISPPARAMTAADQSAEALEAAQSAYLAQMQNLQSPEKWVAEKEYRRNRAGQRPYEQISPAYTRDFLAQDNLPEHMRVNFKDTSYDPSGASPEELEYRRNIALIQSQDLAREKMKGIVRGMGYTDPEFGELSDRELQNLISAYYRKQGAYRDRFRYRRTNGANQNLEIADEE